MKTIAPSVIGGLLLCHLLLFGCSKLPTKNGSVDAGNAWRFDAYRITEGQGQIFADRNYSYAILRNGAKATQVQAPDGAQTPRWSQHGASIRIEGCLNKVLVISDKGERLAAEATSHCPAPVPESKPKPINKSTTVQATPLAGDPALKGSPMEPIKQEGKTP